MGTVQERSETVTTTDDFDNLEVVKVNRLLHPYLRLYADSEQEVVGPKVWRVFYTRRVLFRLRKVQDIILAIEAETDWKTLKWLDYLLRKAIQEYREAVDLVTY